MMAHADICLFGGIFNPPHNQRFNTATIGLSFDELREQLERQGIVVRQLVTEDPTTGSDNPIDAVRIS